MTKNRFYLAVAESTVETNLVVSPGRLDVAIGHPGGDSVIVPYALVPALIALLDQLANTED